MYMLHFMLVYIQFTDILKVNALRVSHIIVPNLFRGCCGGAFNHMVPRQAPSTITHRWQFQHITKQMSRQAMLLLFPYLNEHATVANVMRCDPSGLPQRKYIYNCAFDHVLTRICRSFL